MCGRFSTAELSPEKLKIQFGLKHISHFETIYNIAPSLHIPAIREQENGRSLALLKWGLIPHWLKENSKNFSAFNARVETLTQKPFFRDPFKMKRCIVPASGFYEWKKISDKKQPYYIFRNDGEPLAFAGLWDAWTDMTSGEVIESCSIVTVPASFSMASIHDRMPAILESDFIGTWLDTEFNETHVLQNMIREPDRNVLDMFPVSRYVSNARNDGKKCIEEIELN